MGRMETKLKLTQKISSQILCEKIPSKFIVKDGDTNDSFPTSPALYALNLKYTINMHLIHKQERSKTKMRYTEICLQAYSPTGESNKVLDSYTTMWKLNV
jgi:hypothetical protein